MAILDTELGWEIGDAERILLAIGIGIGQYTINEITVCCNQLGEISPGLVSVVQGLLEDYDAVIEVQKGLGIGGDAGRILVKADVLEWKAESGGRFEALMREKGRIGDELLKIFSFCPVIAHKGSSVGTSLVRS
jgi:hypothetical protein